MMPEPSEAWQRNWRYTFSSTGSQSKYPVKVRSRIREEELFLRMKY